MTVGKALVHQDLLARHDRAEAIETSSTWAEPWPDRRVSELGSAQGRAL